jgi:predicted proteasome-type protease
MFEAATVVGAAIRQVYERDHQTLSEMGIDFNCSFILGGQIRGESCRLFQIYAAGNFIEAHSENPCFQIGESKYGNPGSGHSPGDSPGRGGEVCPDLYGFHPQVQYLRGHAT